MGVLVGVAGQRLHALEDSPRDLRRRRVERRKLEVLLLAEVDADERNSSGVA